MFTIGIGTSFSQEDSGSLEPDNPEYNIINLEDVNALAVGQTYYSNSVPMPAIDVIVPGRTTPGILTMEYETDIEVQQSQEDYYAITAEHYWPLDDIKPVQGWQKENTTLEVPLPPDGYNIEIRYVKIE